MQRRRPADREAFVTETPEPARAELLARIASAFDGVPAPDAEHLTIHQAEAADSYESSPDRTKDHVAAWQNIPESHWLECQWALAHLDEQGIAYYLPALMTHYLAAREHVWIHESLEYTLAPSTGDLREYQRRRFSLLTAPQRAAIERFVTFIEADEETIAAWRRTLEAGNEREWFDRYNPG